MKLSPKAKQSKAKPGRGSLFVALRERIRYRLARRSLRESQNSESFWYLIWSDLRRWIQTMTISLISQTVLKSPAGRISWEDDELSDLTGKDRFAIHLLPDLDRGNEKWQKPEDLRTAVSKTAFAEGGLNWTVRRNDIDPLQNLSIPCVLLMPSKLHTSRNGYCFAWDGDSFSTRHSEMIQPASAW
jgi:hypothetical protein